MYMCSWGSTGLWTGQGRTQEILTKLLKTLPGKPYDFAEDVGVYRTEVERWADCDCSGRGEGVWFVDKIG